MVEQPTEPHAETPAEETQIEKLHTIIADIESRIDGLEKGLEVPPRWSASQRCSEQWKHLQRLPASPELSVIRINQLALFITAAQWDNPTSLRGLVKAMRSLLPEKT